MILYGSEDHVWVPWDAVAQAKHANFEYIFMSERHSDSAYGLLPAYWDELVAAVSSDAPPPSPSSCIADPEELRTLLALAADGDTVTICDGDYKKWEIEVEVHGVRIQPETLGRATFHDGSWFDLKGDRNTLAGIKMHGGGDTSPIQARHS